jgi:hypothetical protein
MTIKELVAMLKDFPPDMPVIVNGYEGGYNDVSDVVSKKIVLDYNSPETWYYGSHEDVDDDYKGDKKTATALLIH